MHELRRKLFTKRHPMPKRSDQEVPWGRLVGIGLEIAVGAVLGYAIGSWLDRRYGWNGTGTLIGVMIGLAGGMYLLIRDAIRINKD
jgi:F0F1-type ATP synthase assembly protein I